MISTSICIPLEAYVRDVVLQSADLRLGASSMRVREPARCLLVVGSVRVSSVGIGAAGTEFPGAKQGLWS